jgi:hypothetical protein
MLCLSLLLHLVLQFIFWFFFTVHHAIISRFQIKFFLKFVTALRVSAYRSIIRCAEIRWNLCASRDAAIGIFVFTVFLNEVNVLVCFSMPYVLTL